MDKDLFDDLGINNFHHRLSSTMGKTGSFTFKCSFNSGSR